MVTTQPGSDIEPNQYMFGYDIDPSYPGGLRGRKADLLHKTGILGTPLKAIRAELDIVCQVLQTTSHIYQLSDSAGVAPTTEPTRITHSSSSGAMQANNKAVHIGTGSGSAAKWYGIIPHQQFGVPAVATPSFEDSELAPPAFTSGSMFGLGYKGATDNASANVYIQSDKRSLASFTTTGFISSSTQLFVNATAICNNGSDSASVLVYDSGTNILYKVAVSSWTIQSETTFADLADISSGIIVSDMEVTSSDIYFLVSRIDGSLRGDREQRTGIAIPEQFLYRSSKTLSGAGSVVDITPNIRGSEFYFQSSSRIAPNDKVQIDDDIVRDGNLSFKAYRRSLFRIGTESVGLYLGMDARARLANDDRLMDDESETTTMYYKHGGGVYHQLYNAMVFRFNGSSTITTTISDGFVKTISETAPGEVTWLSYDSANIRRSSFSVTTGQVVCHNINLDLESFTFAWNSPSVTVTVSTSTVKNAASIYRSGVYYHLNGDASLIPSGRYAHSASNEIVGSLGTITIDAEDGGFTEAEATYFYRFSYLYDGYQESPLTTGEVSTTPGAGKKMNIKVYVSSSLSRRVSHINIYRAQSQGTARSFFQLVETVSLSPNITSTSVAFGSTSVTGRPFTYTDNFSLNQLGPTYESNAGLPETISTSTVRYGLSAQSNGYHFVGDCSHTVISDASQYIFRSVQGQFDNFNYLSNILRLPEKPTELAVFRSRLYAFTKNKIWRIEPNSFYVEDEMEGYGITNKGAVVVTEYGMFFAGPNGIYYTDGSVPQDISYPINKNYSNETFGLLDPAYLNRSANNVFLNYDPRNRIVLVIYRPSDSHPYRTLAYSIDQRRWDHWDGTDYGTVCGAPCSLSTGLPTIMRADDTKQTVIIAGGTADKNITYYGPWLDMGEPGTEKWFYEVKVQYRDAAIQTGTGSILIEIDNEGADPIVSLTSAAALEEGTTMPSSGRDAVYKYPIPKNGSVYRSGKRIRLAFTSPAPCKIDSYSIIYRPKEFKGGK